MTPEALPPHSSHSYLLVCQPHKTFPLEVPCKGDALSSTRWPCVAVSDQKRLADPCSRHRQATLQVL